MPNNFVITKQSPLLQDDVDCNYCHTDLLLDDLVTECERCGSPHHADCWEANDKECATFGCTGAVSRQAANQPAATARPQTERANLPRTGARNFPVRLNARRVFGGVAFIALMLYTLIFEAGAPSTAPTVNRPISTPAPIFTTATPTSPLISPVEPTTEVVIPFTTCDQAKGIDPGDCAVLIKLYEGTDGPNWRVQTGWMQGNWPCDWEGVSCVEERVTQLQLSRNQLTGEVPPELGNLSDLNALAMSANKLRGELPAELGELSNLTLLFLGENELSGELPRELGELANLTALTVGNNHLSGTIPPELGQIEALKSLDLKGNQLSGFVPRMVACSPTLVSTGNLDVKYNQLTIAKHNQRTSADKESIACLNRHDEEWLATQTVSPTDVEAILVSEMALRFRWTPILFNKGNGYYEIGRSDDGGATFAIVTKTPTKEMSSIVLINEFSADAPDVMYALRSVTAPFYGQKNELTSDFSEWVSVQVGLE